MTIFTKSPRHKGDVIFFILSWISHLFITLCSCGLFGFKVHIGFKVHLQLSVHLLSMNVLTKKCLQSFKDFKVVLRIPISLLKEVYSVKILKFLFKCP